MTMTLLGEVDVEFELNLDGHRDFFVTWLVETDHKWIGPLSVLNCPGMPVPGTPWSFGPYGEQNIEIDPWAVCQGYAKVTGKVTEAPNYWWLVRQQFSTRPFERPNSYDRSYSTPMAESPKVRGGFSKRTEEVVGIQQLQVVQDGTAYDMVGSFLRNTAWERIGGKNAEFEKSIPHATISMNFSDQGDNFALFSRYIDHLNDEVLWGFPRRCVKLSDVSFERMVYGQDIYFITVNLEFDVDVRYDPLTQSFYSGFDRRMVNYGERTLLQTPGADPNNPLHTQAYRAIPDREKSKVILDKNGNPWVPGGQNEEAPYIKAKVLPEANFFDLYVPTQI